MYGNRNLIRGYLFMLSWSPRTLTVLPFPTPPTPNPPKPPCGAAGEPAHTPAEPPGTPAEPPETPAYKAQHEFAETWREQKLRYEQNDRSNATVPVLKVVTTASEHKAPNKNAPIFLRKPAGLPGGRPAPP